MTAAPNFFSSASQSPHMPAGTFPPVWPLPKTDPDQLAMQFQSSFGMGIFTQGLDPDFGTMKPNFGTMKREILSPPNHNVMMGMGDPMICSGFDDEAIRL
ncbi:hypothetical protein OCS_06318 [Ophiocordyceps sinensis CO18]|nr:hypothetical protein OCS_06318 [Ophiocordyceps sinensis CO18]